MKIYHNYKVNANTYSEMSKDIHRRLKEKAVDVYTDYNIEDGTCDICGIMVISHEKDDYTDMIIRHTLHVEGAVL